MRERGELERNRNMAMSDSADAAMANLMIQSQESHLLSPDISAAGSDSGHVEDLKGHSFPSLAGKEAATTQAAATPSFRQQQTSLNPSTCSNTTATTARKSNSKSDPSQPTQKPGPGNRTTKSNDASAKNMGGTSRTTQSASRRRPTPINVQIVRAGSIPTSSSASHKTTNSQLLTSSQHGGGPAHHAFTMTLLPMTKIRELCLHASAHARRHLDLVLDGSRLEARDRDGHVFKGHETISEEVLSGETIYLVEGGLDARGAAAVRSSSNSREGSERPKSRSRERGRLLCLKSLELEEDGRDREREVKGAYRTPSVSSRASSSSHAGGAGASKGKSKSEPRMTPSQRALAIAQMGLATAAQSPVIPKKRPVSSSSAVKKSLPSPALEKVGVCSDGEQEPGDDTLVGEPDDSDDLERTLVAASSEAVRISTPPPSSPKKQHDRHHDHHEVPPNLQDSQLVIPDSQDPFSQDSLSQQSVESQHPAPATSMPKLPDAPKAHPQRSPRVKATTTTVTQHNLPTSKPDPYDINSVLLDEEDLLSDGSNSSRTLKMAPSVRKLGSATASRKTVAPPPVSLPSPRRAQSNPPSPSRANRAGVAIVASAKTATPTKKATTPVKADPSSPAAPLPSSPTAHVAAAISKGGQPRRDRTPRRPSLGQAVIRVPSSDSEEDDDFIQDDDLIEAAFRNMSASNKSHTSLPWSQPPLRAALGEAGVEKQLTPRRRLPDGAAREVKGGTAITAAGYPKKSPVKKSAPPPSPGKRPAQRDFVKASSLITRPSKREEATIVHDSESEYERDNPFVKMEEAADANMSGRLKESLMEMPPPPLPHKKTSQRSPIKSLPVITSPSKKEEATVIHDASSAESDDEQDIRPVKKEATGEGLSPFLKTKLAGVPAVDENPAQQESNQHEVIEVSSGSDSDYDVLDDILEEGEEDRPKHEPELPTIDAELPVQEAQAPFLPQGPAAIDPPPLPESPMTDPVKIEPNCEQAPPSAQTSKRRRDASQEPDPEEENRRKRVKNEAKKARRKQNREQTAAMLLRQQEEEELAALEEQRKKTALERAHRRALELEVIVSSPSKRELSLDLREEADDDDSGVGSSPPTDDSSADAERVGVLLDRDDKNDSLSSKEAEDNRPSWRKLSKIHLLSSPPKTSSAQDSVDHLAAPPTSTPAIIEAQLQQCVEERFHRMVFDDWAFLENTLGKGLSGGYDHSPLAVHNRVHLDMMHRAQHPPIQVFAAVEGQPVNAHDEPQNETIEISVPRQVTASDDILARARSQRSEAPSPKEHRVMEPEQKPGQEPGEKHEEEPEEKDEEKQETPKEMLKRKKKTRRKLWQERKRKEKRGRLAKSRYHQDFRPSRASSLKQKKQKQKQARNGQ